MTQLLTLAEAGERLQIHIQSVRELIWAQELEWVNISTGKRPRIRVTDHAVDSLIERRTVKATKRSRVAA